MADTTETDSQKRLKELEAAAKDWFARQKRYLDAEYTFLDAIQAKRGGSMTLQDANALGAEKILVDSINEYLNMPVGPTGVTGVG